MQSPPNPKATGVPAGTVPTGPPKKPGGLAAFLLAHWGKLLSGVVLLNLLAGGVTALLLWKDKQAKAKPAEIASFPVSIRVVPSNAVVKVDGQIRDVSQGIQLSRGPHTITATLDGYDNAETKIDVLDGATSPVELRLSPLTMSLQFFAKLPGAAVLFDGGQIEASSEGWFQVPNVSAGAHTIELRGGPVQAKLTFQAAPPGPPTLSGPIEAMNALVVAASYASDGRAQFAASGGPAVVKVTRKDAAPNPIELAMDAKQPKDATLGPAEWDLVLQERGRPDFSAALRTGNAPMLAVLLRTDLGQVDVTVDPADARVTMDRQGRTLPSWRAKNSAKVSFANLEAGDYRLRVEKDGFDPQERTIKLAKGGHPAEAVKLVEKPKKSSLEITGLPAGAEGSVTIDNQPSGTLTAPAFQYAQAEPGRRTVRLSIRNWDVDPVPVQFNAGETVRLAFDAFKPRKRFGRMDGQILPATATLTLSDPQGNKQVKKVAEMSQFNLEFGRDYSLLIEAPNHRPATVSGIQVRDTANERTYHIGARKLEEIARPKVAPPPPQVTTVTLPGWNDPTVWGAGQDDWRQYRKGDPTSMDAPSGNITFEVKLGRSIKWQTNFADSRNFVAVELRKDRLTRRRTVNGKREEEKNYPLPNSEIRKVRVSLSGDRTVHSVWDGGKWLVIDELGGNAAGKFVLSDDNKPVLRDFQYVR